MPNVRRGLAAFASLLANALIALATNLDDSLPPSESGILQAYRIH